MFHIALLIFDSVLILATAQITSPGGCDESVKVVQNFDLEAFSGLWYEVCRYTLLDHFAGDCVTSSYTIQENRMKISNRMVLFSVALNITGDVVMDSNVDQTHGKLHVTFPSINQMMTYWILSVKYDSYALIYLCENLGPDKKMISTWILSRSKEFEPKDVDDINKVIENTNGLDWDLYRYTNQSELACQIKTY